MEFIQRNRRGNWNNYLWFLKLKSKDQYAGKDDGWSIFSNPDAEYYESFKLIVEML